MLHQKATFFRPYFVYFAVLAGNLLSFTGAIGFNWSATIVPHLQSNDTSINPLPKPLTTLESSWIVSIFMIGCLAGPFIGGVLIATLGKKKSILLLGIPAFTGHLMAAFSKSVWVFLFARFAMGLTLGCSFGVMASYIGDIAEDKNRGLLGSSSTVLMSMGGLYVYIVGPFVSLRIFSLINLIPLILLFTLFGLFVPDTPFDFLQKNVIEEAKKSLALYRGKTVAETEAEFKKLLDSVKSKNEIQVKKSTMEQLKIIYHSQPLFRGFKMVEALLFFKGVSGMAAVASYYQAIFDESSGSLDSTYSVMIVGVVAAFSSTLTSQLVERLGRKILLLGGYLFMGLSLFALGTYFLLKSQGHNIETISWLPLASLMIHTLAYNFQGSIPWIYLTDIFPSDVLDFCTTIASVTMWIMSFSVSLVFPYLKDVLGNYGTFYLFGGCMICALVFAILFVPETKGRSVEEVQNILTKPRRK